MSEKNIYLDFFALDNLALHNPDYLDSKRLYAVSALHLQKVVAKPLEALRRTMALEAVIEVSLLDSMLLRAQRFFYTLPYAEKGEFAHTLGAYQFFLYSSEKGFGHYLANAPKVTQARTVIERFANGILFVAANLITLALEMSRKVSLSYNQKSYSEFGVDLQTWVEDFNLQSKLTSYIPLSWHQPNDLSKGELTQKFKVFKDALFPPGLQSYLTCIYPNWEKALFAICSQQGTDLLQTSLEYGRKAAMQICQTQLRPQELRKIFKESQQLFAANSYALGQEIVRQASQLHGNQHLACYLQQKVAFWQLHLASRNLKHQEVIDLLRWGWVADYLDLHWQELSGLALKQMLQKLCQEYKQMDATKSQAKKQYMSKAGTHASYSCIDD
ncbi:hypothetical protein CJP74_00035 [Psittacicella melopsittaci]|uniref:Uncharacterized protein n=1 Tax=Psittacicella melopsittaci TaxID=2028576 RepID=A0A3A1Y7K2_9GAMM|nr:hypothetical protein [Psittacicella melopsittaci]RIY34212.1 hypothetical protein CJP74_00035 [Psittacicella melopsittaci]